MDKTYPPEAWADYGRSLQLRRWHLGYRYRRQFVRARKPDLSEKTVTRIEKGERPGTYPPTTLAAIESLYVLAEGATERYFAAWPNAKLEVQDTPNADGHRFTDPRLDAIANLPAESPQTPWGFTPAELEALMATDLGQRALQKLQPGGEDRLVTHAVSPSEDEVGWFSKIAAGSEPPVASDEDGGEQRAAG